MVGLEPLILVPHILLCVVPPVDGMVCHPGYITCFPQSRCVGLYRVVPYPLMLADRHSDVGGDALLGRLFYPGGCVAWVFVVVLCMRNGGGGCW